MGENYLSFMLFENTNIFELTGYLARPKVFSKNKNNALTFIIKAFCLF